MSKKFSEWNELKIQLHNNKKEQYFKERDIFWVSIGVNIGFEQDGKGEIFSRPVLIVKKYGKNIFFGIPLSTQLKEGSFFFDFELDGQKSSALLVQARIYDAKRLENKIGKLSVEDFKRLKIKPGELLEL